MYRLVIYKVKNRDRWRWKFIHKKDVIARGNYHNESPEICEKYFNDFCKAVNNYPDSCTMEVQK